MGLDVKTDPLPGIAIVAALEGGEEDIVPSKPIEPVPGGGFAANADLEMTKVQQTSTSDTSKPVIGRKYDRPTLILFIAVC